MTQRSRCTSRRSLVLLSGDVIADRTHGASAGPLVDHGGSIARPMARMRWRSSDDGQYEHARSRDAIGWRWIHARISVAIVRKRSAADRRRPHQRGRAGCNRTAQAAGLQNSDPPTVRHHHV